MNYLNLHFFSNNPKINITDINLNLFDETGDAIRLEPNKTTQFKNLNVHYIFEELNDFLGMINDSIKETISDYVRGKSKEATDKFKDVGSKLGTKAVIAGPTSVLSMLTGLLTPSFGMIFILPIIPLIGSLLVGFAVTKFLEHFYMKFKKRKKQNSKDSQKLAENQT
jgi:hypothetical protein